ncbi:MAG TPA: carbamoyltransferase [Candidatus Krumholzibacteria bacterium]|nr:carbamoyltransferase [Candidatus Krumholzibacteria bacterium]HRX49904.1 carbamoyltransferase [Candidatus Krumholzibacteria bacterium]
MTILGISALYHDAAACLVQDGRIVAAAQEERFTRRKHDAGFPLNAVAYCLAEAGVPRGGVDAVVFYDKPLTKFGRILKTSFAVAPAGLQPFLMALPQWLRGKLWTPGQIERALEQAGGGRPGRILFTEHHEAHAASAFFPSPFASAAVLTMDGVGEWTTTSIGRGRGNDLELLEEIHFPHSLGLLYSAVTYFTGFRVNSGEYKVMGLAPYGEPVYADLMREHLIDIRDDGSFRLNMDYFGYADGLTMTNERFATLFGGPARAPESALTRREMDLARSVQDITEEIVLKMGAHARRATGERHLCLAGGVALNCVANGKLLREGIFDDIWIQPASGDAGGALGAALHAWHVLEGGARTVDGARDAMAGAYLGPEFPQDEINAWLDAQGYPYELAPAADLPDRVAAFIEDQKVVGNFQGRMEFGPRALGNRSILGDARSPAMQSVLNLKIKYRESFRPFAPSCLEERISDFFEIDRPSPYMLLVAQVRAERCLPRQGDEADLPIMQWVNRPRSDVPAITHVDDSARIQSVSRETNPRYHAIIEAFERRTGYGIVINTSFNVRGEPIVCTPEDAYRCFMRTEMDVLVLGDAILRKEDQPPLDDDGDWREEFQLD